MAIFDENTLLQMYNEAKSTKKKNENIVDRVSNNIDDIEDSIKSVNKSMKKNFDKNMKKIKSNSKKLKLKINKESGDIESYTVIDENDNEFVHEGKKVEKLKNGCIRIGKAILRPLDKAEEKTLDLKDAIVFQGKKYVYQTADDARDAVRHPIGTGASFAGSAAGGVVGAAIGGPIGASVGAKAGSVTGNIVGSAMDMTKSGRKIGKGYQRNLDKMYKEVKPKKESFDYNSVYRSEDYNKVINEFFDTNDKETRDILLSINEDDQTRVVTSLVSKLYDNIIDKVDDIDFGDIPGTRGDITKLPNYEKLHNSVLTMRSILIEYKQDTAPIDVISTAMSNIITGTSLWKRGFAGNVELPMVMYNTIVLSIIEATTYMISMCIQFVKVPSDDSFQIVVDKSALVKTKDHMIFDNLIKFNDAWRKNQIQSSMEYVIKNNSKNFVGELGVGTAAVGIVTLLFCIIPILRELIFLFYYNRVRISEYFDMQADMLQVNAYNVEHNRRDLTSEERKSIATKQMKVAERFRSAANVFAIKMKESEKKASKDLVNQNKKYKADEVLDQVPDSASSSSALF